MKAFRALGAVLCAAAMTMSAGSSAGQGSAQGPGGTAILPSGAPQNNVFFLGTTTPLGSSATYTGAARDVGVPAGTVHPYSYFNGFFFADQAGTASLECSNDNATFVTCASSALTASTPLTLTVPVMFRYHRAKLVNGSTIETVLVVNSSYTAS